MYHVPCISGALQPVGSTTVLLSLLGSSLQLTCGMFYLTTLRAAKDKAGRWRKLQAATPKQQAKRDMHAFTAVWAALCKDESAATYMKHRQRCS